MNSSAWQLRLDGSEVPHETVAQQREQLTDAQRMILRKIGEDGGIRPVDAGRILHSNRADDRHRNPDPGRACCKWASADGVDALKRLGRRGYIRHRRRGWWISNHE